MVKNIIIVLCLALSLSGCASFTEGYQDTDDENPSSETMLSEDSTSKEKENSSVRSSSYDLWEEEASADSKEDPEEPTPSKKETVPAVESALSSQQDAKTSGSNRAGDAVSKDVPPASAVPKASSGSAPPTPKSESKEGQQYIPEKHPTDSGERVVYWGETGTKYHIDSDCRSFRGNTPHSGSIEDAITAGRNDWCGICSKGMK